MQINSDSIISRSENILHCELEDQMVLMNIDTGEYYEFDPIASAIWDKLENNQTVASVCEELMQEFEVQTDQCQQQVLEFFIELLELGVIDLN